MPKPMLNAFYRYSHLLAKGAHHEEYVCVVAFDVFTGTNYLGRLAFVELLRQDRQISVISLAEV